MARYDDQFSARDFRRECSRDDSWRHRQDSAEQDRAYIPVTQRDPHELARMRLRLQRRSAVAAKRATLEARL